MPVHYGKASSSAFRYAVISKSERNKSTGSVAARAVNRDDQPTGLAVPFQMLTGGSLSVTPAFEFIIPEETRYSLATQHSIQTASRRVDLSWESPASFEQIIPFLLMSVKGDVTTPALTASSTGVGTATATLKVVDFRITNPGIGFSSAPTVAITGVAGSPTATISAAVSGFTGLVAGSSYTSAPTVEITGGGGSGATAIAAVASGAISALSVTSGSGYTSAPTVEITGGGGTGATATASITGDVVSGITVTAAGTGYTSTPTVEITGGGGSGATAIAIRSGNTVGSISVTSGSGYTSTPTVAITGGGGSGASATATISGGVASITRGTYGSGLSSPPAVTISGGGGGVGATAVALLGIENISVTGSSGLSLSSSYRIQIAAPTSGTTAIATARAISSTGLSIGITEPGSGYLSPPTIYIASGMASWEFFPNLNASNAQESFCLYYGNADKAYASAYCMATSISMEASMGEAVSFSAEMFGRESFDQLGNTVASIFVTNGGSGYTSTPTVAITGGGGSGATADALLTGSRVTGITVTARGSGYTSAPAVEIAAPPDSNDVTATAQAVLSVNHPNLQPLTVGSTVVAPIPDQEFLVSTRTLFHMEDLPDDGTGLDGVTFNESNQLSGFLRNWSFSLETGLNPFPTADNTYDYGNHTEMMRMAEISVTYVSDNRGWDEYQKFLSGEGRAIRLEVNGTNGRKMTIDALIRYDDNPEIFSDDEGNQVIVFSAHTFDDHARGEPRDFKINVDCLNISDYVTTVDRDYTS